MSTFVLVHGSFHGAWCWYKVIPGLKKAGHRVIAVDLPSLGSDKTPVSEIGPDTWADAICDLLSGLDEPVILVGHSRGGIVISQAAERSPDKIESLVYLSGYMVPNGESLASMTSSPLNAESLASSCMQFDMDLGHVTLSGESVEEAFFHLSPPEDVELARLMLQPEAIAPLLAEVKITEENYGQLPRTYIELLQDKAISLQLQRYFQEQLPCDKVISIDTDHSAFFGQPEEVVQALLTVPSIESSR